jgi:hypothetical protein
MRSRWMLVFAGVRRATRWVRRRPTPEVVVIDHDHIHDPAEPHPERHRVEAGAGIGGATVAAAHHHGHRHVGAMPDDPFMNYGKPTAFGVGMIHGVGAETPTQVLVFLAAAGAGGATEGLVLLACFLVGLLTSNSLIAAAGTFGFLGASKNWPLYVGVSVVTAVFSLVIGTVFLTGNATVLPAFFGG